MLKKAFLIGISGGSGSGKTAFIQQLRSHFTESELALISEDNYYHPIEKQQIDANGVHNFDIPEAIDHNAFLDDLAMLQAGQSFRKREYVFNNETSTAAEICVHPAPVIIVEGLFVFHHVAVFNQLNLKVLIDAKDNLKIIRRIKRDQVERNYPIEDVLYRYQFHVGPAYDKYILPYLDEVDIIINNNKNFDKATDMFKAYIESLLKS